MPVRVVLKRQEMQLPRFFAGFPSVFDGFPASLIRDSLDESRVERFSGLPARLKNRENGPTGPPPIFFRYFIRRLAGQWDRLRDLDTIHRQPIPLPIGRRESGRHASFLILR
jgi:hypothetical protein